MPLPIRTMKAKVCMVGEAAVGKTSLVRRFVHDAFSDGYVSTLGAKVTAKDLVARAPDGGIVAVRMTLWDLMGDTAFLESLGDAYFLGTQGLVAVCDLTRYSTFERLPEWLNAADRIAGDLPKALAVNKTDLRGEALVLYDEHRVQQFAAEVGARWYLTSAKTGANVEAMFSALARDIVAAAYDVPRGDDPGLAFMPPSGDGVQRVGP